MGLIKMALGAGKSVISDQIREYFYCDKMEGNVLMRKGYARNANNQAQHKYGATNNNSDNIISNGSVIAVNEGQGMLIVEDGKIVDFTMEAGNFTYDKSSEPSLLYGGFGKGLLESFKTFGKRFTFGGDTGKDQRVYFINLLPIMGGKFGTQSPVDYLDDGITLRLAARGTYSIKIAEPLVFYSKLAGNVRYEYTLSDAQIAQFRSDVISSLSPALQMLSFENIPYAYLLGLGQQKLTKAIEAKLAASWEEPYGLNIASLNVEAITPVEDDNYAAYKQLQIKKKHAQADVAQGGMNQAMQQRMAGVYTDASGNPQPLPGSTNASGSAMDIFGMAMMNQMMGGNAFGTKSAVPETVAAPKPEVLTESTWKCVECGTENTKKFCMECGSKKPEPVQGWTCSCGSVNKGKFCPECGAKKPPEELLYRCDKCGWEPEDPAHPPKFCPECGDRFDDSDVK